MCVCVAPYTNKTLTAVIGYGLCGGPVFAVCTFFVVRWILVDVGGSDEEGFPLKFR